MGKKIAVLITDEFEDSEFTSPAEAFRKAGHEVVTIEKEAGKTVKGHKGEASVTIDESIDNVSPSDFPFRCPAATGRPFTGFPARGRAFRHLYP